ncbi:MAG: TetR/AcrR family transcriptional regulator [Ruminococcaceae bacterium]|nr:TetR/AcrR family transcriptional regulator [Oscillospiraceae bacterium]
MTTLKSQSIKSKTLHATAKLFLEKGYTESTVREIAEEAGINVSAMIRACGSKEDILCELVAYVLEGQFESVKRMLKGITDDKILFYAAETTLQLYMAESSEHIRELYSVSYSLPKTSEIIYHAITQKLEDIFKEHLPELETKDFYEYEIASAGIMRNFMTVPCDMYFTMERKVARFLETTFLVYRVPDDKIKEAINFVSGFDYPTIAQNVISNMLSYLENQT